MSNGTVLQLAVRVAVRRHRQYSGEVHDRFVASDHQAADEGFDRTLEPRMIGQQAGDGHLLDNVSVPELHSGAVLVSIGSECADPVLSEDGGAAFKKRFRSFSSTNDGEDHSAAEVLAITEADESVWLTGYLDSQIDLPLSRGLMCSGDVYVHRSLPCQ